MTYDELISNLKEGTNFSFSRFGDGELACMFGKTGANCDGHTYFPDLGKALFNTWINPKGIIGMQRYGYNMYKDDLGPNRWPDADVLHRASIRGELNRFCETLYDRHVILVGPEHLRPMKWINIFIEVPLKNAWIKYDHILERIQYNVKDHCIVLYCCGMMAEILIWEMFSDRFTQVDTGSVFDPYCGVKSRTYHKKLKI